MRARELPADGAMREVSLKAAEFTIVASPNAKVRLRGFLLGSWFASPNEIRGFEEFGDSRAGNEQQGQ